MHRSDELSSTETNAYDIKLIKNFEIEFNQLISHLDEKKLDDKMKSILLQTVRYFNRMKLIKNCQQESDDEDLSSDEEHTSYLEDYSEDKYSEEYYEDEIYKKILGLVNGDRTFNNESDHLTANINKKSETVYDSSKPISDIETDEITKSSDDEKIYYFKKTYDDKKLNDDTLIVSESETIVDNYDDIY